MIFQLDLTEPRSPFCCFCLCAQPWLNHGLPKVHTAGLGSRRFFCDVHPWKFPTEARLPRDASHRHDAPGLDHHLGSRHLGCAGLCLLCTELTVPPCHPPQPLRTRWNGSGTHRSTHYVCYQPEAKGGHARHVETGQFTPPKPHSPEAIDS